MAIRTRPAKEADLDWIVRQLKEFAIFYGTKHSLFGDEAYVRQAMTNIITKHVAIIAENVTEIPNVTTASYPVGFAAALMVPHCFNPRVLMLAEQFWWVAAEHRNGRAGLLLLNELIAYGLKHADIVSLSIIEGRSPINQDALTKRGFKLHESAYIMEV